MLPSSQNGMEPILGPLWGICINLSLTRTFGEKIVANLPLLCRKKAYLNRSILMFSQNTGFPQGLASKILIFC